MNLAPELFEDVSNIIAMAAQLPVVNLTLGRHMSADEWEHIVNCLAKMDENPLIYFKYAKLSRVFIRADYRLEDHVVEERLKGWAQDVLFYKENNIDPSYYSMACRVLAYRTGIRAALLFNGFLDKKGLADIDYEVSLLMSDTITLEKCANLFYVNEKCDIDKLVDHLNVFYKHINRRHSRKHKKEEKSLT